jgi:hypothetical protein
MLAARNGRSAAAVGASLPLSGSPLSPQDIRAAAEVHRELGPEYSDAIVASFLDQVDREIAARVDARLAGARPAEPTELGNRHALLKGIAIGIAASGITIFLVGGNDQERLHRVVIALLVLAVVCSISAGLARSQPGSRRAAARQRPRAAAVSGDRPLI